MRNLRNVRFGHWTLGGSSDITSACWDPNKDEVLCTLGPTAPSSSIQLVRLAERDSISHRTVARWDAPSPSPELPADRVVSIQYLGGTASTCIVFEGGDVVTVQEDQSPSDGGARIEIADVVVFMANSFDPLHEISLTPDDLRASKHVSVGWGKKETQFQGRGAKALRDPTISEKVDQGIPSPHEYGATAISWRGDGAYVAINSARQADRRVIRVYSRDGELDSATEPVDGLEASLSWRPSGNLIAGIQRLQDRVDLVFFERNGLRHGQFTLRCPENPAFPHSEVRLQWNSDSTVLAVAFEAAIQLWVMGNYHWYLKQEVPVGPGLPWLAWHPEKALRFIAAAPSSAVLTEHIFHTTRGTCWPPFDNGAVAVIDGQTVKLTSFR
ncbi:hypothetical protein CDD83_3579 [Cordyceps sp. RAO-2017]|nr:hypothetical protein CDD83_3579 [Cordyceps sp. RAO-2017]